MMLGRLRLALISFLFATVAFSESTSPYDPFRGVVLQVQRQPEPPICCLKPSPPLDAADDQVLLSFEDWKAKQSQMQADASSEAAEKESNRSGHEMESSNGRNRGGDGQEGIAVTDELGSTSPTGSGLNGAKLAETLSPHFKVPITDRFNYASLDCSARVHTAHRGAKSSSAILTSKKDRYMLSPCNTPNTQQFVVVELCEDIRIDTVQLANFEFFSGVFKEFSVSVAKTYNGPWASAGTYRAKNIRGVQSFHTPGSLQDFYRYIRIDFHSHYGNEYYCPLSLLRVYGLTHLEKWKWELWEAESKSKQAEYEKATRLALTAPDAVADTSAAPPTNVGTPTSNISSDNLNGSSETFVSDTNQPINPGPASPILGDMTPSKDDLPSNTDNVHPTPAAPTNTPSKSNEYHDQNIPFHMQALHSTDNSSSTSALASTSSTTTMLRSSTTSSSSIHISTTSPPPSIVLADSAPPAKSSSSDVDSNETTGNSSIRSAPTSLLPPTPSANQLSASAPPVIPPPPNLLPPPVTTGGESIYRTIMNRLHAIETNHTLYARYIEQQNGAIRDLIKRLNEDIGRLEAITRAQKMTYQKTAGQWEKEKTQMVVNYNQLRSKIEHLSEEIVLEKRLGVVQLCLLLAVLIFVGLTRGSRGESIIVTGPGSVREWGKRHLSLSGDWNRFIRRSSSRSPVRSKAQVPRASSSPPSKATATRLPGGEKVNFPKSDDRRTWPKTPLEQVQLNTAPLPSEYRARQKRLSQTRSRTPSLRSAGVASAAKRTPQTAGGAHPYPPSGTPTPIRAAHLRPQLLQRSSSQGTGSSFYPGVMAPKSAKKWARSAHIHPFKTPTPQNAQTSFTKAGGDENVFLTPNTLDGGDALSPSGRGRASSVSGSDQGLNYLSRRTSFSNASGKAKQAHEEGGVANGLALDPQRQQQAFNFSGDDRDTESNWADTDSVVGSMSSDNDEYF